MWPATTVQTCVIHLIRNTFRLSSRQHWDALKHDLKPIYTAPTEAAARAAFDDLADRWGKQYPAIIRLWNNAWQEFIPFLDYDTEITVLGNGDLVVDPPTQDEAVSERCSASVVRRRSRSTIWRSNRSPV